MNVLCIGVHEFTVNWFYAKKAGEEKLKKKKQSHSQ